MVKRFFHKVAILLILSLVITSTQFVNTPVAKAKEVKPAFSVTKKTIYGIEKSYTLKVKNLVKGATSSWSSSDKNVATVTGKGVIKTVSFGSTTIRAKITLPNKKVVTLTCKVSVKSKAATQVTISNSPLNDTMQIGDTFQYIRELTPKDSTDSTTWKIKKTSVAKVDKNGLVTALSPGTTVLIAKSTSGQTDSVPIIVTEKTASVAGVDLVNGTQLQIRFKDPINTATIIGSNQELINVTITRANNKDTGIASDFGELTGSLSPDLKTLTINATKFFAGDYQVQVSSSVKTTDNITLTEYNKVLSINDITKPVSIGYSLGETGVIAEFTFSEPISTDYFVPVSPVRLDNTQLALISSSFLTNKNNYILSNDRKTLRIDLSNLDKNDQGKLISVQLVGVMDIASNQADTILMQLQTDITPIPQAKIISMNRSAYQTISVIFDRPIKETGTLQIGNMNTNQLNGVVDKDNNKRVNYALNSTAAEARGNQAVTIIGFSGYNATGIGVDTKTIDFTINAAAPKVVSTKFGKKLIENIEQNTLTVMFDKEVTVTKTSGLLQATLYETDDNVTPILINYTSALVNKKEVILVLKNDTVNTAGTYEVTLPKGLVRDAFQLDNLLEVIRVSREVGINAELPAPTIIQSTENPSEIILNFTKKIDKTTAEIATNYNIPGVAVIMAKVISNTDAGATVRLTVGSGTVRTTNTYAVIVSNVKGANNSYGPVSKQPQLVTLKENVAPYVISAKIGSGFNTILIKFSEAIKGVPVFDVNLAASSVTLSPNVQPIINNDTITITLANSVNNLNGLFVIPTATNNVTDLNGNKATISTMLVTY